MRLLLATAVTAGIFAFACATFDHGMADTAYTTEQLRCVDNNNTKPEIDACRAAVRLKWGITETVTDAGVDHD